MSKKNLQNIRCTFAMFVHNSTWNVLTSNKKYVSLWRYISIWIIVNVLYQYKINKCLEFAWATVMQLLRQISENHGHFSVFALFCWDLCIYSLKLSWIWISCLHVYKHIVDLRYGWMRHLDSNIDKDASLLTKKVLVLYKYSIFFIIDWFEKWLCINTVAHILGFIWIYSRFATVLIVFSWWAILISWYVET